MNIPKEHVNVVSSIIRRFLTSLLLALCIILPVRGQSGAYASGVVSGPTGLRPPTPEEQTWMDENMIRVEQVFPNRLAHDRVASEHEKHGTGRSGADLLSIPVAEHGSEFRGATRSRRRSVKPSLRLEGASSLLPESVPPLSVSSSANVSATPEDSVAAADSVAAMAYPGAVDNSVESWFPPISSQGQIGSCASFSTTYYTMTSQVARLRGWDVKNDSAGAHKFSTRFIYNQINNGGDNGSWITTAYDLMKTNGAPSLQTLPYTSDFLSWPTSASVWREALNYRMADAGTITGLDTDAGLANAKQMLANGYILNYATDIYQWQYTNLKNDPATTADDWIFAAGVPVLRQKVCTYLDSSAGSSGHGMTIVGYNDNVWTDLNNNGVVDPGEKGAFRIANSWGTGWQDGGYVWVAYDALKAVSAVVGGPASATRVPAFWSKYAYWISARPSYTPSVVAEVTLSSAKRNQLSLKVGRGATTAIAPSSTWTPASLANKGGALSFNGTTTAVQATFAIDCTDLVNMVAGQRWFVSLTDNTALDSATFQDLRFLDSANNPTAYVGTNPPAVLPQSFDKASLNAYADYVFVPTVAPSIIDQPQSASVTVGRTATFSVRAMGAATLTFQWLRNGSAINGATSASYSTQTTTMSDSGATFSVVVTNGSGSVTSNSATLTVNPAPVAPAITDQPQNISVTAGQTATFSVTATGSATLTYQWKKGGTSISGATSASYTTSVTTTVNSGSTYTVVVTNALGSATSTAATLTVTAAPTTAAVNFVSGGNGSLSGTTSQTVSIGSSTTAVTALPASGYHFVNWTGTGGFVTSTANPLIVANVTTAKTITANFALTPNARISATPFGTLSSACAGVFAGGVIESRNVTFSENLTLDRGVPFTLKGGYADDFDSAAGYTTLIGVLVIGADSLTLDRLVVQ
ncbi:MAG: hypothetical protein HXX11_20245 [Desulfuromonadales bacterium]|nr:hypothetical protein [Desulfuromonadales bacterium]